MLIFVIRNLVLVTKCTERVKVDLTAKDHEERTFFVVIDYKRDIEDDVVSYSGMENIV